ncbi:MAG TPA: helix-turn-helix transcriptional regulator [Solirubrobacteraceae bacterium]|nr:helix-turn-helix transcriptional regulator [Solirubrobacteraceae bacterium]
MRTLVGYVGSLASATSFDDLERRFLSGAGAGAMYGYELTDPSTAEPTAVAMANVSDAFLARYAQDVRHADPVRAQALRSGRPAYNLAMMSPREWEESPAYRRAYRMHRIRHLVVAPLTSDDGVIGELRLADSDPDREVGREALAEAAAIADVLAATIERLRSRDRLRRERDELAAAFELTSTAIIVSDPHEIEPRVNAAARRLLAEVVDADARLAVVLARPPGDGPFARGIDVELVTGEEATLEATSTPRGAAGTLVTVLDLQRATPQLSPAALTALTEREVEVAVLIVDGLADREIAERIHLSHHTVTQYVKRIYRKLDVDSRVTLTRLLLGGGR